MTQKFLVGDTVYIPSSLLPDGDNYPTSIYRTSVTEIRAKSVKVRLRDGDNSDWIASSKLHKILGIAIITIGDFSTEETLLNPLAKSILQFSRLLFDDDSVTSIRIRAIGELSAWWRKNQLAYSHIVFIGHGSSSDIYFGCGGARTPMRFQRRVFSSVKTKKIFISLCCETGRNSFASAFSAIPACSHLIAPFHSIHGAVASQFFQTYMCWHLLHGKTTKIAFNKAASTVPGKDIFRLWKDGTNMSLVG
jgi:hypothetical protein